MRVSQELLESATLDVSGIYSHLRTRPEGLTTQEADRRLAEYGPNILVDDQHPSFFTLLLRAVLNPLVILLAVLAAVSAVTGDPRSATMMLLIISLSLVLKLIQETKAGNAAAKLKAMISIKATVDRDGATHEIPIAHLVPGDVVQLGAGDMIPGDVRILTAKDLFVVQGSLTGESFPVEKFSIAKVSDASSPLGLNNIAFLGTSVASGSAKAVVVATGQDTYLN
ncbi:MAG TPA: cation-transporting P-type ATPase, partial [Polyangiaceae bacterium]|nr:cation-transporting P-type ATPase [Polyangiaceae bacterium]